MFSLSVPEAFLNLIIVESAEKFKVICKSYFTAIVVERRFWPGVKKKAYLSNLALNRLLACYNHRRGIDAADFYGSKEKGKHYASRKSIHLNRASGRNRHNRAVAGDIDAGPATGEKAGAVGSLPGESASMDADLVDVHLG